MKTNNVALLLGAVACLVMFSVSCSSPERKGKRMASMENQICEKGLEEFEKLTKTFTDDFAPAKYSKRQDAKEEWFSRYEELSDRVESDLNNAREEVNMAISRMNNKDRLSFQKSYWDNLNSMVQEELRCGFNQNECPEEVLNSIARIKPVKPDAEQMKKDLGNHELNDVEGGYYYENHKTIKVEDYDISDIIVNKVIAEGTEEYVVEVSLTLLGKSNNDRRFDVTCEIRYVLPKYDDWTIDFVKTVAFVPVSSDRYNGCVKLTLTGGFFQNDLYVKNEIDKSLEVFVKYHKYGEWNKKVVVVQPLDYALVTYGTPDEYSIVYVMPL